MEIQLFFVTSNLNILSKIRQNFKLSYTYINMNKNISYIILASLTAIFIMAMIVLFVIFTK